MSSAARLRSVRQRKSIHNCNTLNTPHRSLDGPRFAIRGKPYVHNVRAIRANRLEPAMHNLFSARKGVGHLSAEVFGTFPECLYSQIPQTTCPAISKIGVHLHFFLSMVSCCNFLWLACAGGLRSLCLSHLFSFRPSLGLILERQVCFQENSYTEVFRFRK